MKKIVDENTKIADTVRLGENVRIGVGVVICDYCIIGNNVVIEDNVYLDCAVVVRDNVTICESSTIGSGCILGEYLADFYQARISQNHPLTIGTNSLIRSGTIIYGDNTLGDYLQTGHRVTIREQSKIGSHVRIGTLSDIQGYCEIQDYVNIHSSVHVGQKSIIKKYAWLFPYVVLTNDPNPPSEALLGVTIEEFAIVATGTVVLPGRTISTGALVGAGSVVTKDITANIIAVGNPAREKGSTDKIKDSITGNQVYPWQYVFDRGMPWENVGYENWIKEQ